MRSIITRENVGLLTRTRECWDGWATFRAERERCKRFTYGDQWNDVIEDRGVRMREEEYIRAQGNMPLKNNLIRRLVRNVLGVYRNRWRQPYCEARDPMERPSATAINALLRYLIDRNRMGELYARTMEEFLISGIAVHKKWYGRKGGRTDCHTDIVAPDTFFVDMSSRDFRGEDISLIGEIHAMSLRNLLATFATVPADIPCLREIYGGDEEGECVVLEIWHKETVGRYHCHDTARGSYRAVTEEEFPAIEEENRRRRERGEREINCSWSMDEEWRYTFLSPAGHLLSEGVSPYAHGRHPYIYKAYPFIDGEIHSFVSDVVDQQKLTNRLISMYDWILRASAKGVLLFPEGALPEGVDINDVADEWGRFNGVIVFRPRAGVPLPQQLSSKCTDVGITELLEIQMNMMEDISGVNGALQGKLDNNSMSGTLYNQQTQNSMTALADLLESFDDFVREATAADVSNLRQYYTPRRVEAISGARLPAPKARNYFDSGFDFRIRIPQD